MAEKILFGYLIDIKDYQLFDNILTFITPTKRFSCLSLGSRKINSKNSRNLFYGSKSEIIFFESRNNNKLSRLKKINNIDQPNWSIQNKKVLYLLNDIALKTDFVVNETYLFYEKWLNYLKEGIHSTELIILLILKEFIQLTGLNIIVDHCPVCGSKKLKTFSFKEHGIVCDYCYKKNEKYFSLSITKNLYFLFADQLDLITNNKKILNQLIRLLNEYITFNSGIKFNLK